MVTLLMKTAADAGRVFVADDPEVADLDVRAANDREDVEVQPAHQDRRVAAQSLDGDAGVDDERVRHEVAAVAAA
jgi:hypothetical protein